MIKTETKKEKLKHISLMPYFAGSIVSLISALAFILLFALIIRYVGVSTSLIVPINVAIKTVSIAIGVAVATKDGKNGIIKGVCVGILFTILCNLVFAIISKSFSFGLSFLADIALSTAVGAICGILFVNLKKN